MLIFNVIIIELKLILNTLLKFNIHIQTYAGSLSVNVTLLLRIATKSLSNISCDKQLGFNVHFK